MFPEFKMTKGFVWQTLSDKLNANLPLKIKSDNGVTDQLVLGISLPNALDFVDNTTVTSLGSMGIYTNDEGSIRKNITFSSLKSIGSGAGYTNGTMSEAIFFTNVGNLQRLVLPSLEYINGSTAISGLDDLETLSLSSLKVVTGRFVISSNQNLAGTFILKDLISVGQQMGIYDHVLTRIEFPKLRSTFTLLIGGAALTYVDISSLAQSTGAIEVVDSPLLTDVKINPNGIRITNSGERSINFVNNALTQACVDTILASLRKGAEAQNLTGYQLRLDGGTNSAPTGGIGNPDYNYLVNTKGWNVQINP
jgi:hypothetical protein